MCRFCGGETAADDLLHTLVCDGRQGCVEAAASDPLYGQQGDVGFEASSATSAAAAHSLKETDLSHLEAMVYGLIRALPQTCDAVEVASGLSHQTASARIRGLVLREQLVDSGARARTRSGRFAVVWRVTTAADRESTVTRQEAS